MNKEISYCIYWFLKELQDIEGKSHATIKSYRLDLNQVFSTDEKLLNYNIITEDELLHKVLLAQSKWGHLTFASRNRKAGTLKSFFGWLYRKAYIDTPLAEKIAAPKVPKKIPNFISVDEAIYLVQLLNSADNDFEDVQFIKQRTLILLLYGGGLRVSEACDLIWSNVSIEKKQILVKGKGGKERWIVLPDVSIKALQILKRKKSKFIWGDQCLSPRVAYNWVIYWGLKAGFLRPLNPHALRHSYATHLLQGGADLRVLQELLGHQSLIATEKYTHLTVDHLARVVSAFHPLKGETNKK